MSKLSDRLTDVFSDSQLSLKTLAQKINISASCLTYYSKGERVPTIESHVKIADYFNCSTDYLLGREEDNRSLTFEPCPPFCERLAFLKKHFGCTAYQIYHNSKISKSGYYEWLRGEHVPSLDNIVNLADAFGCRVDFVLGRES